MLKFFASLFVVALVAACAPPPDYTTSSGVAVYDSAKRTNADEVQAWLEIIAERAPKDDSRVRSFADVYDGATLTIADQKEVVETCVRSEKSRACSNGATKSILLYWEDCPASFNTASTLAHEIGHLMGYKHNEQSEGAPWFFNLQSRAVELLVGKDVCGWSLPE